MEELDETLRQHHLVGIDSAVIIYYLEDHPHLSALASTFFTGLVRGYVRGITSVVSIMEVTVKPLQFRDQAVTDEYVAFLNQVPNLRFVDIDQAVAIRAAALRAAYRLQAADALQIASCIEHGATAFLTNDRQLQRVIELDVLLLEDFLDG